jgi:biopolymer transport protein ExbB
MKKMKPSKELKKKDYRSYSHRASTLFATIVMPIELIASILVYKFVMGNPVNFQGGDPVNNPLTGNYLGIVYKGGVIVPILLTLFLVTITFALERLWTLRKAKGKSSPAKFVGTIKHRVQTLSLYDATQECDLQGGCVASVVRAGLDKYQEMDRTEGMSVEKRALALQKEIEEVGGMEMPMLEKNLVVLSTIASISTLMGLFGTVLGMIKAFSALAQSGAPDAVGLANGISEALVNTAMGIGTSALAIVFYNYFTTRIDHMVYLTAEAGQSIIHTFTYHHTDRSDIK